MDLRAHAGQFTFNPAGGNQVITGVPFRPKLTIFQVNDGQVNATAADWQFNWGAAATFSLTGGFPTASR